jgi:hypothetical protein
MYFLLFEILSINSSGVYSFQIREIMEFLPITSRGLIVKSFWRVRRLFDEYLARFSSHVYYPKTILYEGRCLIADSWIRGGNSYILFGLMGEDEWDEWEIDPSYRLIVMSPYLALVEFGEELACCFCTFRGRKIQVTFNYIQPSFIPQGTVMATTTCRDDYRLVSEWTRYHQSIGITFFLIYYNGKVPRGLVRRARQRSATTQIVNWNLPYYWDNESDSRPDWHHGQILQMTHALWFAGKQSHDWIINFDLDEYLACGLDKITELAKHRSASGWYFQNVWVRGKKEAVLRDDRVFRAKQMSRCAHYSTFKVHITESGYGLVMDAFPAYMKHYYKRSNPWRELPEGGMDLEEYISRHLKSSLS